MKFSFDQIDALPDASRSSLAGSRAKLERAHSHLQELQSKVKDYLANQPFQVEKTENQSGDLIYSVRISNEIPSEISTICGDLLHNTRTVLDYLVWTCVEIEGNKPTKLTAFPISDDEQAFDGIFPNRMKGAGVTARRAVRLLRPYRGGNDLLWKLHKLDIADKHRLLVGVGAAYQTLTMKIRMNVPWKSEQVRFPPLALEPSDRLFPLRDGDELYRVKARARGSDIWSEDLEFTFQLYLGDGDIIDGIPLIPFVETALSSVGRIIIIFGRRVFA